MCIIVPQDKFSEVRFWHFINRNNISFASLAYKHVIILMV